jgi:hypothetical protein
MRNGLQELAGEAARLRGECDYLLSVLGELERLGDHHLWISDAQDELVGEANRVYARSARDNLERATNDLRNWGAAVQAAMRTPWWPPV